ncbi:MAG TPA: methyltransferase domain-containing protein [Actinomycetota bacterium]|nr:methyltransferase domain-containing protein [Actinomycetota bacterium]
MDTEPIAAFFDREAEPCCASADPGDGVAGVSSVLLERLERAGIEGRTVLDLGCGTGGLALEALRRGADRTTGIDLSAASIEVARRRAAQAGLAGRARFEVGDAAAGRAEAHDAVVLDKSICCYPNAERFVRASAPLARSLYAFSVPESRGPRGLLSRVALFFDNAWRALRRDPFRGFVHDVRRIEALLREQGFRPVGRERHWIWHVGVYAREPLRQPASGGAP